MARITVEDCVEQVPNRFDLVILAAQRAREIAQGAEVYVDRKKNKNPVVALREIAEQEVSPAALRVSLMKRFQRVPVAGSEEDIEVRDLMASEQHWVMQPESLAMHEEIAEDNLLVISETDAESEETSFTLESSLEDSEDNDPFHSA